VSNDAIKTSSNVAEQAHALYWSPILDHLHAKVATALNLY
jgi:hypothetical protein